MGINLPPFYGNKKSKFYAKKIQRAQVKIEKQKAIIAECEKQIINDNAFSKIES